MDVTQQLCQRLGHNYTSSSRSACGDAYLPKVLSLRTNPINEDAGGELPSRSPEDARLAKMRQLEQLLENERRLYNLNPSKPIHGSEQISHLKPHLKVFSSKPSPGKAAEVSIFEQRFDQHRNQDSLSSDGFHNGRRYASTTTGRLESASGTGVVSSLFGLWAH